MLENWANEKATKTSAENHYCRKLPPPLGAGDQRGKDWAIRIWNCGGGSTHSGTQPSEWEAPPSWYLWPGTIRLFGDPRKKKETGISWLFQKPCCQEEQKKPGRIKFLLPILERFLQCREKQGGFAAERRWLNNWKKLQAQCLEHIRPCNKSQFPCFPLHFRPYFFTFSETKTTTKTKTKTKTKLGRKHHDLLSSCKWFKNKFLLFKQSRG